MSQLLGQKPRARKYPKPNAKAPLGEGGRFQAVVQDLMQKGMSRAEASAIAANQGRKKLGKAKFQSLAAKGRNH